MKDTRELGPKLEDWRFVLEGYTQSVETCIDLDDEALVVAIRCQRTGKISKRQSPWITVAFARVPDATINCDMFENERWNSETFMQSLHTATVEDRL